MKQIVEERKDIAFYQSMYPLLSIHPKAYDKGHAVLCAKSNEESLKLLEDAYAKKTLPKPDCDNTTMEKQMAFGKSLGINSTPTILFMDGSRVAGVMEKDALIAAMDERKPKE